MQIRDFLLERHLGRWEFAARRLLCASDPEPLRLHELLAFADAETSAMWQGLSLGYTHAVGHPALRREISLLYNQLPPDNVLTFAGAGEGIFVVANVALQPGDHALVVHPAYQSLYEVARAIGAEVTSVPLRAEDGWSLDMRALRAALRPRTRLIAINFPHNPTGALLPSDDFAAIADIAREAGAVLLSDEVYRGLELDDALRLPPAVDVSDSAVSLGVISKAYGLGGLRIGWLATRDKQLLEKASAYKDYLSICNAAPSEVLALIALRSRAALVERCRSLIRENLEAFDAFSRVHAGALAWVRPLGGTVCFPRLLRHGPIDSFAARLLEEEDTLILPGSVFDDDRDHFRLGLGRADFPEALAGLGRFLARQE